MTGLVLSLLLLGAPEKTSTILFLVDDLGWTGLEQAATPHLDRLANEGMRFTSAYAACTVCSPTRAAVLTGKYPARLHVTDWIAGHQRKDAPLQVPRWTHYLDPQETTIPEALSGYASAHVGKWHLGNREHWPEEQGFDVNVAGYEKGQPPSYYSPYRIPTLEDGPEGEHLTGRLAAEACAFLARHRKEPFFLYFPFYAVHTPLQPRRDLLRKNQGNRFAAMVEGLDDAVGAVLRELDRLGLADSTVVIFTGDNGGLSHIRGRKIDVTDNAPLRLGKGSAYEGGVRVPMIVRWPGVTRAGSVCHEPVISTDLFATITGRATADGESLEPLLKDPEARLKRDAIFWHYPHYHPGGARPYGAVRARDWKLIEFYEDMRIELYHLARDIGEKNDLAARDPEKAAELRGRLHAWRAELRAQMPAPRGFRDLWDGKTTEGWTNPFDWGEAWVEKGAICLRSDRKFFFVTKKSYRDFTLEVDVYVPRGGNSGIQFRCHFEKNRLWGYQAEVDTAARKWSGGLYDEGRRGWLAPPKDSPAARAAFKNGQWNRYRIVAKGDHLRIRVNGVLTTDFRDARDREGHIALQHHGEKGKTYRFRDIRLKLQ